MDGEFEKIVSKLSSKTVINITSAKEHVTDIERMIRSVKDKSRTVVSTLPFDYIPKLIITNLVYFVIM